MTNVFTQKSRRPRSMTHLDYQNFEIREKAVDRQLSPTRNNNPHPLGLTSQDIPVKDGYLIWHPSSIRDIRNLSSMICHIKRTNFSSKNTDRLATPSRRLKRSDVRYTEDTTSRETFINPCRLPHLVANEPRYAFSASFWKTAPLGIEKVNFSCNHPDKFDNISGRGKVPNIKYTENTTSRDCFANPAIRFPTLITNDPRYTTSCTTRKNGVTGIVPNLKVPEYLPVIDR